MDAASFISFADSISNNWAMYYFVRQLHWVEYDWNNAKNANANRSRYCCTDDFLRDNLRSIGGYRGKIWRIYKNTQCANNKDFGVWCARQHDFFLSFRTE